jgi:hypothetical protein
MNSISTFAIGAVASFTFKTAWTSFWGTGSGDSLIQTQLVETLRSQLDRCGPEALGARPCPACHTVLCETPWVSLGLSFLLGGCASVLGLFYFKFKYYPVSGVERHTRIDVSQIESGDDLGPRWAPAGGSNSRLIRERPRLMDA